MFRAFWQRQKHAVALIGIFISLSIFLFVFVELVRANQLTLDTSREIAEFDASWKQLQLQVLRTHHEKMNEAHVHYFRSRQLQRLENSRLAALARTTPKVEATLAAIHAELHALDVAGVKKSAAQISIEDPIAPHVRELRSWSSRFTREQRYAFRNLLVLYGGILIASIGVAIVFARHLWSSEQKELEDRLLAQRFIRIQEDERARIAAEIHDDATQSIAGAELIAARLAEELGDHPYFERLRAALGEGLATLRNLSRDLGIPGMEHLTLIQALEQLVERRTPELELEITHEHFEDRLLSAEQKLHAYRILQECVTNTASHAQAQRIRVRLVYTRPDVMLRYSDDGVGFDPSVQSNDRPHLGLRTMRERARMLGGELAVTSKPGRGTQVTLLIPASSA
ncbi:MAG: sensor histidine kinase [Spirochaetia bacterium]